MSTRILEAAGGIDAMRLLAQRWHDLAVRDPIVAHAFSPGYAEDYVERLAAYLVEALGGPARDAGASGPASHVDRLDAGNGTYPDFDEAGIAVFAQAVDDVAIPEPAAQAMKDYWAWATRDVLNRYAGSADDVPDDLAVHRWSWDGPVSD